MESAKQSIKHAAETVKESVSNLGSDIKHSMADMGDKIQGKVHEHQCSTHKSVADCATDKGNCKSCCDKATTQLQHEKSTDIVGGHHGDIGHKSTMDSAKESLQHGGNKLGETGQSVKHSLQEGGLKVQHSAEEAGSSLKHQVHK